MYEVKVVGDLEKVAPEIFEGLSPLEKEALVGVISRGLVSVPIGKFDRSVTLLPWNYKQVAEAAETLIKTNNRVAKKVAGRAATYLLRSPGFYQLNPDGIVLSINLFTELKERPEDIGRRVASVVCGENDYHNISRYHQGISPVMEQIKANYPKVYPDLWIVLPQVITPVTFEGAIQEIKSREGRLTGGAVYFDLKEMKGGLDGGGLEAGIRQYLDQYGSSRTQADSTIYDRISSQVNSQSDHANHNLKFFKKEQLTPFMQVLSDFEVGLGQQQFEAKGYVRARESVNTLNAEMEEMHKYVVDGLSQIEIRLKAEREQRRIAQQPFYKKLLCSFVKLLLCF